MVLVTTAILGAIALWVVLTVDSKRCTEYLDCFLLHDVIQRVHVVKRKAQTKWERNRNLVQLIFWNLILHKNVGYTNEGL